MDGYILHAQSTRTFGKQIQFQREERKRVVAKNLCVSDTRVLDNLNANKYLDLDILQLCQYENNSKYINYKYTNNNMKCRKKLISIKPISDIEHLNKVIHRKEIYE